MGTRITNWFRGTAPGWLRGYGPALLRSDLLAGITVGVMLIPQGVAYAAIAGVPPIYGLYAALVPLLVYPLLGTSRQLSMGPRAVDMVIVAAGLGGLATAGSDEYVALAVLLMLLAGALQFVMGLARLGFLADLLSRPVIAGFTAAAALIIAASQLGNLLGLDLARSQQVHTFVIEAARHLGQTHGPTLAVGAGGIALLLAVQRWKPVLPGALLVAVGGGAAVWGLGLEAAGVAVIGELPIGLPGFVVPAFSVGDVQALIPTALTLGLVQFMSVASLARVFAQRHEYTIRPNRELLAVGAANAVGSFFQGIPAAGSFSRSAVNDQAGARSPLANVFTAAVVGLALLFLMPLFYYVPMAALAAIIVVAALGLIDLAELRALFEAKWREGAMALFTFVCTLAIGIQEGLLLGVGASVLLILYRISRPNMVELGHLPGTHDFRDLDRNPEARGLDDLLILRVDASFSFANAEAFKDFILDRSAENEHAFHTVILEGSGVNDLDTTAIDALYTVIQALNNEGIDLYLTSLVGPVRETVRRSGLDERFGADYFQRTTHQAVQHVLRQLDHERGGGRLERYRTAARRKGDIPVQEEASQSEQHGE